MSKSAPRCTYCTFVEGDDEGYVKGVLALARSLRQHACRHPLVVAATPTVPDNLTSKLAEEPNVLVRRVEWLEPPAALTNESVFANPQFARNFTKLRLWECLADEWDKAVYLDADTLAFANLDDMFLAPAFSAVLDNMRADRDFHESKFQTPGVNNAAPGADPTRSYFNAGVFVFEPGLEEFRVMCRELEDFPTTRFAEQDFLNRHYRGRWNALPLSYNHGKPSFWLLPDLVPFSALKVVHFSGSLKPWHRNAASGEWRAEVLRERASPQERANILLGDVVLTSRAKVNAEASGGGGDSGVASAPPPGTAAVTSNLMRAFDAWWAAYEHDRPTPAPIIVANHEDERGGGVLEGEEPRKMNKRSYSVRTLRTQDSASDIPSLSTSSPPPTKPEIKHVVTDDLAQPQLNADHDAAHKIVNHACTTTTTTASAETNDINHSRHLEEMPPPPQRTTERRPRVLFVVHRYYPFEGGSEYYVHWMAKECARRGWETTVLTGTHAGDQGDGVRVTSALSVLESPPSEAFDVVVVHGNDCSTQDECLAMLEAGRVTAPVMHLIIKPSESRTGLAAARHAALIGCATTADWRHAYNLGASHRAVPVIHGVDENTAIGLPGFRERRGVPKSGRLFVSAGGFGRHKRMLELARAFGEAKTNPDDRLFLFGYQKPADDQGDAYLEACEAVEGVTTVLGAAREEVLAALAEADLYVMHSEWEGFGLVLLEAMLNGCPWAAHEGAGAAGDLKALGQTYGRRRAGSVVEEGVSSDASAEDDHGGEDLKRIIREAEPRSRRRADSLRAVARARFTVVSTIDQLHRAVATSENVPEPVRRVFLDARPPPPPPPLTIDGNDARRAWSSSSHPATARDHLVKDGTTSAPTAALQLDARERAPCSPPSSPRTPNDNNTLTASCAAAVAAAAATVRNDVRGDHALRHRPQEQVEQHEEDQQRRPRSCVATLLCGAGDYIEGALVLQTSLRAVGSELPFIVAVTPDVPPAHVELLTAAGAQVRHVSPLQMTSSSPSPSPTAAPAAATAAAAADASRNAPPPQPPVVVGTGPVRAEFACCWTKVQLWRWDDFDTILYMDSDMIVTRNIDHIARLPALLAAENLCAVAAARDMGSATQGTGLVSDRSSPYFNAGLLVLKPGKEQHRRLLDGIAALGPAAAALPYAEQDALQGLCELVELPPEYNCLVPLLSSSSSSSSCSSISPVSSSSPSRGGGDHDVKRKDATAAAAAAATAAAAGHGGGADAMSYEVLIDACVGAAPAMPAVLHFCENKPWRLPRRPDTTSSSSPTVPPPPDAPGSRAVYAVEAWWAHHHQQQQLQYQQHEQLQCHQHEQKHDSDDGRDVQHRASRTKNLVHGPRPRRHTSDHHPHGFDDNGEPDLVAFTSGCGGLDRPTRAQTRPLDDDCAAAAAAAAMEHVLHEPTTSTSSTPVQYSPSAYTGAPPPAQTLTTTAA